MSFYIRGGLEVTKKFAEDFKFGLQVTDLGRDYTIWVTQSKPLMKLSQISVLQFPLRQIFQLQHKIFSYNFYNLFSFPTLFYYFLTNFK
jgi:hypothetical protein